MSNKPALRVIGKIGAALAKGALDIVDMLLLEKIPIPEIADDIRLLLKPIYETIDVLSDKDPNNLQQLREVWEGFVKSQDFVGHWEMRIHKAIKLMKDGKLKDFLSTIIPPALETCKVLIQNDEDKEKKIMNIWFDFLSKKEHIEKLFGLIVKNEKALSIAAGMIEGVVVAVDELIDED